MFCTFVVSSKTDLREDVLRVNIKIFKRGVYCVLEFLLKWLEHMMFKTSFTRGIPNYNCQHQVKIFRWHFSIYASSSLSLEKTVMGCVLS